MLGRRYELLNEIGGGGMGRVFRAYDRLSGQEIALKQVARTADGIVTTAPTEDHALRLALAQEFRVLASLRHPHIVSVLDYGFDESRMPYFTMELLENALPIDEATQHLPQAKQIELLAQMFQALLYLHRRGVLHRDLKPSNVLVSNGVVKVLDFGLAIHDERPPEEETLGTLPYLPPELLFGKPPTERSDLYSAGLVAHEVLLGSHPFITENRASLVNRIVNHQPTLEGLDVALQPILQRLLQKVPDARFENAAHVIESFGEALGVALPIETNATRESFLRAAKMVDREQERALLSEALSGAMNGYGGVWLVSGESGVGKTRLLDELRAAALVGGAQVVRGQPVSEGAALFSVWTEPLRYLALLGEPTPREASALKPIIPNISILLGSYVEDPPSLDPEAAQVRLAATIETLLGRMDSPLIILLEDLHFAGGESLSLLNRLARIASGLPVLIIGSYRDDERPSLPEEVPNATRLRMERLPRQYIGDLTQAMLGEVGRNKDLVDLLERETQGNLFFIVEVVRALAQQAGELSRVTEVNLHRRVLTGGVQQIIQQRLARVPEGARPLLRLAAVAGRQLDLHVLAKLAPQTDLTAWLNQCADIALTAQGETWLFAHDKLREALLDAISPHESRTMHRAIAESIEAVHEPAASATRLTYHWAMAGDPAKEGRYALLAGEQAYANGAWGEAVTLLGRAFALRDVVKLSAMDNARLLRLQADAWYRQGSFVEARASLRQAADLLDWSMPTAAAPLRARLAQEVFRQVGHRLSPVFRRSPRSREWLLETHRLSLLEAEIAFLSNETLPMLVHGVGSLNQAESAGISPELAKGSANMTYAIGNVGQHRLADVYKRQARRVAERVGDPSVREFALRRTSLFDIGMGRWQQAEAALQGALSLAEQVGDVQAREESLDFLASMYYYKGDYPQSRALFARVYMSAQRTQNLVHQAWGLLGQAQNDLRLGFLDEAAGLLQTSLQILEAQTMTDLVTLIQAYGLLALTELYRGRREAAGILAQQGIERIGKSEPTGFALLEGYAGAAEVYLTVLADTKADDVLRPALLERTTDAVARLAALAKSVPIARPRAALMAARLAACQGDAKSAQAHSTRARRLAAQLGMPLEIMMADVGKVG
jgi:tetratricopeptide (TPR) repeat protein